MKGNLSNNDLFLYTDKPSIYFHMNKIVTILLVLIGFTVNAQKTDYNTKKGYAIEGYDVVSYFNDSPKKGNDKYLATYSNVKYKFSTQNNIDAFNKNPKMYLPQYGGYCAYAIAVKAKKVSINPETYEIKDGKLYLFYNSWGTNTLESWKKESPNDLKLKADKNWKNINQN